MRHSRQRMNHQASPKLLCFAFPCQSAANCVPNVHQGGETTQVGKLERKVPIIQTERHRNDTESITSRVRVNADLLLQDPSATQDQRLYYRNGRRREWIAVPDHYSRMDFSDGQQHKGIEKLPKNSFE
mmetsp:Transcript_12825/g.30956  ORF Transcript_12825/g.30956 Transcript_12825/m.30956 type:complete len:128 (-) Transcript_12825:104-487(-)